MEASAEVLLLCAGAVVVICLIRAVAGYVSAISFALVGTRISSELRARTFRHLQGLSMRHHSRASTGDTVQRLVGDVSRLQDVAVTAGLPLIGNFVSLIAMMVIMLWLDPLIALVTFVSIGIFVLVSRKNFRIDYYGGRKSRKGESALATTAAQTLAPCAKSRRMDSRTPSARASARATSRPLAPAWSRCGWPPACSGDRRADGESRRRWSWPAAAGG